MEELSKLEKLAKAGRLQRGRQRAVAPRVTATGADTPGEGAGSGSAVAAVDALARLAAAGGSDVARRAEERVTLQRKCVEAH